MKLDESSIKPKQVDKVFNIDGVNLSTISSGVKYKNRDDLLLITFNEGSVVAGVFTKSTTASEAVNWCKKNINNDDLRAVIINAGNANVFNGKNGKRAVEMIVSEVGKNLNINKNQVLIAQTGVIGEPLEYFKILNCITKLTSNLKSNNWIKGAQAIMTTDTFPKYSSYSYSYAESNIYITGISKGSGMIAPNMATMLSFIATDLNIDKTSLAKIQKNATEKSFNMISVDGETSTNDASVIISTGQSKLSYKKLTNKEKENFIRIIYEAHMQLAQMIVNDGEGATKFITINVSKCSSSKQAKSIAMSIGNSLLVKTALFAEDPNWGRIISAIGNVDTKEKNLSKYTISFGKNLVFKNNCRSKNYDEKILNNYLKNKEIEINICCNSGKETATVWTSDLTYQYIKINAEYRT